MKILNNLTLRHLKLNKKRTIVTIIGVILSTALMVGIGLLFSTLRDASIKSAIKYDGDYYTKFVEVNGNDLNTIKNNINVSSLYYNSTLGYADTTDDNGIFLKVIGADENFFKSINLKSGRLPKNETEVLVDSNLSNITSEYYVVDGNNVKIKLSDKVEEGLVSKEEKTYTIVGVIENNDNPIQLGDASYGVFTYGHSDIYDVYVKYQNPKDTYKITKQIQENLSNKEIDYNTSLLALYGVSSYSNIMDTLLWFMAAILGIISFGCIMVIYNSFAISVMERKKQFGLFSSIGATRKQLRYTVFFEALIIGLIGIPLGILSGILGIWVVLMIVNNLIGSALMIELSLSIYPLFVIIPIVFMIATIILSAFIPALRASKVTPIDAIRQNDDIKIKGKKVKTNKLISKLFGVEGEIASKNMKRSKKKYRITVISLFISIVLFITFSYLLEYGLQGSYDYLELPSYNIMVTYKSDDIDKVNSLSNQIKNNADIKQSLLALDNKYLFSKPVDVSYLSDEFKEAKNIKDKSYLDTVNIIMVSDEDYQRIKKENNLTGDKPILINYFSVMNYSNGKRKQYAGNVLKTNYKEPINICNNKVVDGERVEDTICNSYVIDDYNIINNEPFGFNMLGNYALNVIIPNSEMFNDLLTKSNYTKDVYEDNAGKYGFTLVIDAPNYKNIDKLLKELTDTNTNLQYINIQEEMKMMYNIILVIKILLYGFISLVTLIGVTSVFNTINTNINLRRKEFAMLRSVGLTTKGFNKILCLESFFLGMKALIFAIPVSLFNCFMLNKIGSGSVTVSFIPPYMSILIAIIAVFVIVLITMLYSTRKIKHENILEAIREENI